MKQSFSDQDSISSVNAVLDGFFKQSIADAAKIDPQYERLWQTMYSLIAAGGKRLRPQMTLLSYAAFGGKESALVTPVAAAIELLHFSLLIHDDIIDRDYTRYGTTNIAGQYKHMYTPFATSEDNLTHYANSAAMLAGDLILSGAHQLIASSKLPPSSIAHVQQLLSTSIFEAAGGELLDTELSFTPYKNGDALKIATHKTASYSFVLPLLTGAVLADSSNEQSAILREYAIALGIAYQLTDDLLGVFGNEQQTGKSNISDITEGKRTYMVELALDAFSPAERSTFFIAFGNPQASSAEITAAKQLLVSSGARSKTKQKIDEYAQQAVTRLEALQLSSAHHDHFLELINKVTYRQS